LNLFHKLLTKLWYPEAIEIIKDRLVNLIDVDNVLVSKTDVGLRVHPNDPLQKGLTIIIKKIYPIQFTDSEIDDIISMINHLKLIKLVIYRTDVGYSLRDPKRGGTMLESFNLNSNTDLERFSKLLKTKYIREIEIKIGE